MHKHLKTGNLYKILHIAVNATNGQEGTKTVVYISCKDDTVYARDFEEFEEKFVKCKAPVTQW